jgi:hypothetical protein
MHDRLEAVPSPWEAQARMALDEWCEHGVGAEGLGYHFGICGQIKHHAHAGDDLQQIFRFRESDVDPCSVLARRWPDLEQPVVRVD